MPPSQPRQTGRLTRLVASQLHCMLACKAKQVIPRSDDCNVACSHLTQFQLTESIAAKHAASLTRVTMQVNCPITPFDFLNHPGLSSCFCVPGCTCASEEVAQSTGTYLPQTDLSRGVQRERQEGGWMRQTWSSSSRALPSRSP